MKREEKLMERQFKLKMSAATSHQDRKERGEIEALKAQIVKMQLDEKARANKWKAMNENLRQRVGVSFKSNACIPYLHADIRTVTLGSGRQESRTW